MELGTGEIITVVLTILIIFTASKTGAIGNALGRFVYSFRKASQGEGFIDVKTTARREEDTANAGLTDSPPKP